MTYSIFQINLDGSEVKVEDFIEKPAPYVTLGGHLASLQVITELDHYAVAQ